MVNNLGLLEGATELGSGQICGNAYMEKAEIVILIGIEGSCTAS
jgi:hypothetical protein